MSFNVIRGCRRTPSEQRYIAASMRIFNALPKERREAARALIAQLAEGPEEARALFDMTVQGMGIRQVWERTGIPIGRLARLREGFYDRIPL